MTDVLLHFALDVLGGVSLRCAMGLCKHRRHQYAVWLVMGLALSWLTVHLIG